MTDAGEQAPSHDVFRAVGSSTRRAILELIKQTPLTVTEIARNFDVTRSAISQHLGVLREADLVTRSGLETQRRYALRPAGLGELDRFLNSMTESRTD